MIPRNNFLRWLLGWRPYTIWVTLDDGRVLAYLHWARRGGMLKMYSPGERWMDGRTIYAVSWTPGIYAG